VLPAMLTQSLYRYTIVAIPLACIAAGLAFVRPPAAAVADGPSSANGSQPDGPSSEPPPPEDRAGTPDP
jgi:hypothetical protein